MVDLLRCIGVVLLCLVSVQLIRDKNTGLAIALAICGCSLLSWLALPHMKKLLDWCGQMADLFGSRELMAPLVRCLGIGLAVRITAEICRDAGERAMAATAEIVGAVFGLIAVLPLLDRVMEIISGL